MTNQSTANWVMVQHLMSCFDRGDGALGNFPDLLRMILKQGQWRDFITPLGRHNTYNNFADFIAARPADGLGAVKSDGTADEDLIRRLIGNDMETLNAFDEALQRPTGVYISDQGGVNNINISKIDRPQGTSREQALRRLRKDAPDVHARVLKGELTPHAGMIEAGLRQRTVTIPVDDPEAIARTLRRVLDREHLAALRAAL